MRRHPIRLILILAVFALVGAMLTACDTTSAQRLDYIRQAVDAGAEKSQAMDAPIGELTAAITAAEAELGSADDATSETIRQYLAAAKVKLDGLVEQKGKVDTAVQQWKVKLDELGAMPTLTVGDEMAVAAEGIRQIGAIVPGPWSSLVAIAATIIGALGSLLAANERKKRQQVDTAFSEVVAGVDSVLAVVNEPESKSTIKTTLAATQSTQTRRLVALAKVA
jgi:hypothetical protein